VIPVAVALAVLAAEGASAAPAVRRAQDPVVVPRAPLSFEAEARTVNLTVTVRGADGKFVRDLKMDDFQVFDDERPQAISYFARVFDPARVGEEGDGAPDPTAIDLGMLFDTSTSMSEVLKLSQNAAIRFLETIPRARELTTVFFDSDIRLSRFTGEVHQGLFDRLNKMKPSGMTMLYDAIAVYLSRISADPGRKVLVIFSDGEDSGSEISLEDLRDVVRSSTVTIYPIQFTGKYQNAAAQAKAIALMRDLAEMTGGEVFTPASYRDLDGIYDGLLDELAAQYVIGYVPESPKPGSHALRVAVPSKPQLRLRHRRGYFVDAPEAPERLK
jgi:Ca-activated chloride channel family protein